MGQERGTRGDGKEARARGGQALGEASQPASQASQPGQPVGPAGPARSVIQV